MMIIKTYIEEICALLFVLFLGICGIILCSNLSEDYEEKKCVEFYKEYNYITNSCEIYLEKLERSDDK